MSLPLCRCFCTDKEMVAILLSLLLVSWPGIETSDTLFGKSYLIFESEGAKSIITLQRSEYGNHGLKYLEVSIENDVDDVPYQSIIDGNVLVPDINYQFGLHRQTDNLTFIVNFIDPCCEDKLVASIEYSEEQDSLFISYENCVQSVIPYESMDNTNVCYSSSLQLGSHCSLFCTCSSLPLNGHCPSPTSFPMVKCDEFDNSFETCHYSSPSHTMFFHWEINTAIGNGKITSRVVQKKRTVAFNVVNANVHNMEFIFYYLFGSRIDVSNDFYISFDQSFILSMEGEGEKLAVRFDVSSQGEVSVVYANCEQFKMSESGSCYEGMDKGLFYFCEEHGTLTSAKTYKKCHDSTPLKKKAELKVFFSDYIHSSTEVDTMVIDESSDTPGMLHATFTREQFSSYVTVYINDQQALGSNDLSGKWDDDNVITIEIREIGDGSIEGHVQVQFTDDGRIFTVVDECIQFEIFSDKDEIQCRTQLMEQGSFSFCFCNRISAEQSDCQSTMNPVVTCTTDDPEMLTSASPDESSIHSTATLENLQSFDVHIFSLHSGSSESARYKISWEMQETMGSYNFHKENSYVNIDGSSEFNTLDVLNGIIYDWTFSVAFGDRVTVSLPYNTGELFVLHFVPQLSGVELFYRGCSIGVISQTSSTHLPCISESSSDWTFIICPGGATGNPQQFVTCATPVEPQQYNFNLIADLDSAFVGTARLDLQVIWNEERPDYFNFNVKDYKHYLDVHLFINHIEYQTNQGAVFTLGIIIPIEYYAHGKLLFYIELNLKSPIVSVTANGCEQFKLTEDICRGDWTFFYNLKFCSTSEWISHPILTCSGNTDSPIIIPSEAPYETYKMRFSYSKDSRSLTGIVSVKVKQDEGEILERSIVFLWIDDDLPSPFPLSVSFTTMDRTIKETTPSYPYSIPFEEDSPVVFRVTDSLHSTLFEFSILIGEQSSWVIYDDCTQFSIDESEGKCFGTPDKYMCSGESGGEDAPQPFFICESSSPPPLSDLRAFFIYQLDHKIFTWDIIMNKDNDTGDWLVEASETGTTTMQGTVARGNSAASTLTFTISMGELTVFSVVDRQSGQLIDSFSILPSAQSVAVLYNDCTQFTMGGDKDTVDCYHMIDTRICTGEPTKDLVDHPMKACNVMRFSASSSDYGLVSQQSNDKYKQEITIIPSKSQIQQLKIMVDDEPSDSFHLTLDNLQMVTLSPAANHNFYLLALDSTTAVLSEMHCRQFEMDEVATMNMCYTDGGVKLCPTHDTSMITSFTNCVFYTLTFNTFTSLVGTSTLRINHFTSSIYPANYSILTGYWTYLESQFQAKIGDKKMNTSCYYALPPDGSAQFSFPFIPSSSFSLQLNNGVNTAVLHEECLQFYMEDNKGECYQDKSTSLCEQAGGSTVHPYKECHFSSPQPSLITSTTPMVTTSEEGLLTTIGEDSYTHSTTNEEGTTDYTTTPTIATTHKTTTVIPTDVFYASIVLEDVSIRIEKNVDNSLKVGKVIFDVRAAFYSKPDYKIYVDTVEYPYKEPFQVVHHNVGETLNVTIASGTVNIMCVELEIHSMNCTVLELDDCPQFTLEQNVNECRSSDLLCLCASSAFVCPVHQDPLKTCKTSPLPSSPPSTPTTEGALDSTTLTLFDWTTELTESSTSEQSLTSPGLQSTPSIETNTGTPVPTSTSTTSRTTTTMKKTLDALSDLANTTITIENVSQVLEETNAIVNIDNQKMEGQHIYYVSEILYNSANVTGISQSDALLVLDTLDDCLGAPEQSFKDSARDHDQAPQKFLQSLPLLVVNSPSEKLFLNGQQLGFSSQKHACIDEKDSSVFGLADTNSGFVDFGDVKDGDQPKSSIEIPTEAVCGISGTHSFFSIHRTTKLFLGGTNYRKLPVKSSWFGASDVDYNTQSNAHLYSNYEVLSGDGGSVTDEEPLPEACSCQQSLLADQPVLTATVLDASNGEMRFVSRDEENGGKMATVTIDLSDSLRPLHGSLSFSWWDESSLSWSASDHCQLREGQRGGKVIADCFHLTDFTLIVDGTVNDPCVCDTGLIIVGYVISAISICSLFIVVFVTVINRIPSVSRMKVFSFVREDLFRNRFHSVDILYTISLLFFYLIFTLFHDSSLAGHSCVFFAVISYSLLFCTVLLTLFQSYRTIATFSPYPIIRRVLSFASHQIFVCTVSAGAPFLISAILAIVSNFFDRDDGFCWVRPDYITFAVVLPLSVLIINGLICTVLVVIRLYQEQKSQLMSGKNHLKRRIISVLIMQFTLGMPWVLQYFTLYSPTSTVFHYLFTIVNGSQGIILLLLYIYRRDRRMTSMRRRRGAARAARNVQAIQMGARAQSDEEDYYEDDDDLDGKSTDGIVH